MNKERKKKKRGRICKFKGKIHQEKISFIKSFVNAIFGEDGSIFFENSRRRPFPFQKLEKIHHLLIMIKINNKKKYDIEKEYFYFIIIIIIIFCNLYILHDLKKMKGFECSVMQSICFDIHY